MKKGLVCCLFAISLMGCNGLPRQLSGTEGYQGRLTVSSGFPLPYFFMGNAVQWNEDYAVSVRHIPLLAGVVHTCSTGCDMVFIRHRAEQPAPQWREPVRGEQVIAVGLSPLLIPLKGEGKTMGTRVLLADAGDRTPYAAHDGPIVQGMSGGPVYGRDGAVLGITVGIMFGGLPKFGEFSSIERISLYLPYDLILREWDIFNRQLSTRNLAVQRH